jgi:hypothetical protein
VKRERHERWEARNFIWTGFALLVFILADSVALRGAGAALLLALVWSHRATARRDPGLLSFVGFVVMLTLFDDLGGVALRAKTVPFTGWVPTGPYLSCLFFAVVALWSERKPFRWVVLAMLVLEVLFGTHEWLTVWPRASENPWLRVSLWRPLWTLALPLAWIAILLLRERAAGTSRNERSLASVPAAEREDAADEGIGLYGLRS